MTPRLLAIVQLLAVMLASTLMGVLAKWSLPEIGPRTFAWVQLSCAALALAVYTFGWRGERLPADLGARAWVQLIAIGAINFGLVRVWMLLSLEKLPVTTHVYLLSFVGPATMALSAVWLRERPSGLQVVGALLAVLGIRVFFREIPAAEAGLGVLYAAGVVLGIATSNNLTRRLLIETEGRLAALTLTTVAVGIGSTPLLCAGLVFDWPPPIEGGAHWAVVVLNGVVGIALVYAVFNAALRTLQSFEASVLAGSGIVWTALFAYPILGERLGTREWIGIAMMLAGQGLAQIRSAQDAPPAQTNG